MARIAVQGAPTDPGKGPLWYRWQLLRFEVRLQWLAVRAWWETTYLRVLQVQKGTVRHAVGVPLTPP
jgi:hypothetical protein